MWRAFERDPMEPRIIACGRVPGDNYRGLDRAAWRAVAEQHAG